MALAPSALATFVPTTTKVTANPATSNLGTSVTLTATVTSGGLLSTKPSGSVSFSASNGSTSTSLGSATLGSCSGSSCKATLVTSAIPYGSTSVTASYPGSGLTAPSSGSTPVTIVQPVPSPTGSSTSRTCPAGVPCETGYVNTTASALDVASDPSAGQQTVSALLESGKNLHCHQNTDPQVGHLGTFDTTAQDSKKIVHYRGKKNASVQMLANYNAHPDYVGCFGSPTLFQGYVGGVYKDAEIVDEQGVQLYEAQVANCAVHPALPCFTLSIVGGLTQYDIQAPSGDPKIIG
ncbi:MAG TPA: Ig-like domain-containing protein [Jatrophihabitantaceae bacterium]|nr:Ig-like domain-containing protein [Jatrophihabitantaceae bacterium]